MIKALTTGTMLRVVREIHEDESGATLHFLQGGQGRLALGDANYTTHLRLARRSQERQHPVGVTFGERQAITEMIRADNDVPSQVWEEEPDQARVLFQGHDGVFRLRTEHPESARLRAALGEALRQKTRVWFIAQKPELVLLDVLPAEGVTAASPLCENFAPGGASDKVHSGNATRPRRSNSQMGFSAEQLAVLNADYTAVTGTPVKRFVCPITLKDEPEGELCDGHILNDSIKEASGRTVVEYKDVDNYFGTSLEPDLVAFLNAPVSKPKDLIGKHARMLMVTLPSGEKAQAFFANRKAKPNLPRIDLLDTSGATIASPYLRTGPLEPKLHKGLQVEWLMVFTDSAILGAMLKSAHLALFRIMGYRHVLSQSGAYLRQALAAFYNDRAGKDKAAPYFAKFVGAVRPALNEVPADHYNTLDDNALWFHYEPGGCSENRLFAVSCLFIVNKRLITVMVPYCTDDKCIDAACARYEATLKDSSMPQDVHRGQRLDNGIWIEESPLKIQPPPKPTAE
jgi:hypothetical protein